MLERTFVHIPGIGYVTERRLWERGVHSWEHALEREEPPGGFGLDRWRMVQDCATDSRLSLEAGEYRYFSKSLAPKDHWRALRNFKSRVAYVDIETNGLSYSDAITVVGVYDGLRMKTFVRGDNLADFAEEISRYALLVTFNGATFDLPFLRRAFPQVAWDQLHIDLRYVLSKLGHKGGLKNIERELGLAREEDIEGLDGEDAVYLWEEYCRGSAEALDTLLRYNAADVENLERLLALAYPRLEEQLESCLRA